MGTRLYFDRPHLNSTVMYSPLERHPIYDKASINCKVMYAQWQDIHTVFIKIHHLFQNATRGSDNLGGGGPPPSPEYRTARAAIHEEGKQHLTTN